MLAGFSISRETALTRDGSLHKVLVEILLADFENQTEAAIKRSIRYRSLGRISVSNNSTPIRCSFFQDSVIVDIAGNKSHRLFAFKIN